MSNFLHTRERKIEAVLNKNISLSKVVKKQNQRKNKLILFPQRTDFKGFNYLKKKNSLCVRCYSNGLNKYSLTEAP